jgi:hypothetical protein
MTKIAKMEMSTCAAYLARECEKFGIKAPKEGVAKNVLHETYGKLIAAMKKKGVAIGGACEFCDAESPEDVGEFCPYCGESLTEEMPKESKALTVAAGDCVQLTVPIEEIENRLREAVKDLMGNAWQCGDLLKRVRDSGAYRPAKWEEWVAKFGISMTTAGNLIRVVEAYPNPASLPELPLDKVYMIASVPEAHRAEIEEAAATATRKELAAAVREKRKPSAKRAAASEKAHAAKAAKKNAADEKPVKRVNPKAVDTEAGSPLFTAKVGDKLTAPFVDADGKKCQIAEASKKKATATFVLGRNLRVVLTISGDKAHIEIVK